MAGEISLVGSRDEPPERVLPLSLLLALDDNEKAEAKVVMVAAMSGDGHGNDAAAVVGVVVVVVDDDDVVAFVVSVEYGRIGKMLVWLLAAAAAAAANDVGNVVVVVDPCRTTASSCSVSAFGISTSVVVVVAPLFLVPGT